MIRFSVSVIFLVAIFSLAVHSQSRRVLSNSADSNIPAGFEKTSAELYEDANIYAKKRFDEFAQKKIPFSKTLESQTYLEQKQLAAGYAAQVLARPNLKTEDYYNLGLLQALAGNTDGTSSALQKFLSLPDANREKLQTARFVLTVSLAKKKMFPEAENFLAEYLKNTPLRPNERSKMERELAADYKSANNFEAALIHAAAAFQASQTFLQGSPTSSQMLGEIFENGINLHEIQAALKQNDKALATLNALREICITAQAVNFYLQTIDKIATFVISSGDRQNALKFVGTEINNINTNFRGTEPRGTIAANLFRREKQLKILDTPAPELEADKWIGTNPLKLANLRGKVILLDFWATWCAPCFAEFPHLSEWHNIYQNQGLVVIGVTRYYGRANGVGLDEAGELQFLTNLKAQQRLPYFLAVGKTEANHQNYAAPSIPTAVLIDRRGKIRYVRTGAGGTEAETEEMIKKLLAEN